MTLQERLRYRGPKSWELACEAADALDAKDARIRELEGALRDCLAKGSRWHSCDPVVVRARVALKERHD